ncbi:MAG: hypothetical protein KDC55_06295 [Ignavibacteriae bacterium]|nr:hypothetical protein [Ignavibacteriota bacterium]MCB9221740.1 hypothetical protein [Ignavibacteria bacterium]
MIRYSFYISILLILCLGNTSNSAFGQSDASPSNWLYPNGNYSATQKNHRKSFNQAIDKFKIKIVNNTISGDLQPLIGNLVDNDKISSSFPYAPNELVVVSGRSIIILDGTGRVYTKTLDNSILPIKGASLLFDSLASSFQRDVSSHVIMALETIESVSDDSLAHSYLAGFDNKTKEIVLHKRLAVDMRDYPDNIYNSIRPFYGKLRNNNVQVFSTLDIYNPIVNDTLALTSPYLRGMTQFNSAIEFPNFPLPDIGDDTTNRIELANRIGIDQPSITQLSNGTIVAFMPTVSDTSLNLNISNKLGGTTNAENNYLFGYDISGARIANYFNPINITDSLNGVKPFTRPYIVELNNGGGSPQKYILQAEQYQGNEGSEGISKLHLLDINGNFITSNNGAIPSFAGDSNHFWSIAVGDLDGTNNEWLPFFPNNPGNEIIATQSSRNFAHANSRIFILKYDNTKVVEKPTPPNTQLFPFDTIAAARINGRVVAVNDLDNAADEKEEIVVVDGSKLLVLGLRNYQDPMYRAGNPMDTLYYKDFDKEDIYAVEIADMDGDGLNDLIVTTFKATYIIGTPLKNVLTLLEPTTQLTPPQEYCPGDSIDLVWENKILGIGTIDIDFVDITDTTSLDTISIRKLVANENDTVTVRLELDSTFIGKSGYFIIKSTIEPAEIRDSSATISILDIELSNFLVSDTVVTVGETLLFGGEINCFDSIVVETRYLDSTWQYLSTIDSANAPLFGYVDTIPCLPIFSCDSEDLDSVYHYKIRAYKSKYNKELIEFAVKVRPAPFPIKIEVENTADPTQRFYWDPMDFDYACDTISILKSYNAGQNFTLVDRVSLSSMSYSWQIPLDAPDDVVFRFCCENSCVRIDTLITDIEPNYLNIVAPNPFDPSREEVKFVYRVPKSGNITIRILDETNREVVTIANKQFRDESLAHVDTWNGRMPNGDFVANGLYYLFIEFPDGKREFYPIYVSR